MSISSTAHGPSDWHPLPIVNSIQGEQYRHVFRHGSSCVRNGLPSWQPLWIRNLDLELGDNTHRAAPGPISVRWSDNRAQAAPYCSYFNRLPSPALHIPSRNTHEGRISQGLSQPDRAKCGISQRLSMSGGKVCPLKPAFTLAARR